MEKILSLEDLENAENKMLYCTFDEKIEGIDCVTPIHADLTAKSLGDFVEISGNVTGVINLECDLCLDKFEYELDFEIDEFTKLLGTAAIMMYKTNTERIVSPRRK